MNKEQGFINAIHTRQPKAWEQLYACYYTALCRYAFRILDDADLATDIVQGVIIRLWENTPVFATATALRLYLYRAVNNNCLQYIRNKNREDKRLKEWIFYTEDMASESLNSVVSEEVLRKLRLLIDSLPPKRREVILMSMKKMSNEEISEAMQVTIHAVKKHKKEAYAYIRKALGADLIYLFYLFYDR